MYALATGMHKLLVLLYWDNLRQCLVYTYLGLLISMPDSQKVMNESIQIVWFDGEGFSNCQNLYSKWELEVGRGGEGDGVRGKGRGNNFGEPVFMVLKK